MKFRDGLLSALMAGLISAGTAFAINPPFSTVWNSGYEAIPADTEQESLGASRIRDLKSQLRQRLSQDMSWAGDGNDGYHNQVTLIQQANPPIPAFDSGKTGGVLFTEAVNGEAELVYQDNNGHTTQLTAQGSTPQVVPPGTISFFSGPTTPTGYLLGNGAAVSRTTFSNLFANIGTQYGNGDGSTTFNLPDCRARYIAGGDASNATGRLTANTAQGISAATLGNTGGEQSHIQTAAEVGVHTHPVAITDPGHSHTIPAASSTGAGSAPIVGPSIASTSTNSAFTGITASATANAGGSAFNEIPPTIIFNCIIKTELQDEEDSLFNSYAQAFGYPGQGSETTLPGVGRLYKRPSVFPPETLLG